MLSTKMTRKKLHINYSMSYPRDPKIKMVNINAKFLKIKIQLDRLQKELYMHLATCILKVHAY